MYDIGTCKEMVARMRTKDRFWLMVALLVLCGSQSFAASNAHYSQVVNKAVPQVALTASGTSVAISQQAIFTAYVAPPAFESPLPPSGTVIFTASENDMAGNPVKSSPIAVDRQGYAAWNSSFASAGVYNVAASYSGDANFTPASTKNLELSVSGSPDLDLSFASNPVTVKQGASISNGLTLASKNGLAGNVQLQCASPNEMVSCSLVNTAMALAANSSVTTTISVGTTPTTVKTLMAAVMPTALILGFIGLRRKKAALPLMTMTILGMLSLTGCGTPTRYEQTNGTPPGSYPITVTATSGTLSRTATLNVIVTK
jgi:hypothetical protein